MNQSSAPYRPFSFDTVFDGDRVIEPRRAKRAYTPEEVEAARAEAYAEGQASSIARAEGEAAQALRKIADAALDRFPQEPALAALEALSREIEAAPRLLVFASPADAPRLERALGEAAARAGFAGHIVLRPEPGRARAAFVFDWGEGRAAFDPDAAAERVATALEAAIAAEGLHAEVHLPSATEV